MKKQEFFRLCQNHDYWWSYSNNLRKRPYCINCCCSCCLRRLLTKFCVILYARIPIKFYVWFSEVVSQKPSMICYVCFQRAPKLHQWPFPWKVSRGSKMSPAEKLPFSLDHTIHFHNCNKINKINRVLKGGNPIAIFIKTQQILIHTISDQMLFTRWKHT